MSRLFTLAASRRTKWVAALVWLIVAAAAGSVSSKFQAAQKNDPSSYLPGGADLVLAGTFSALASLPLVSFTEIGFVIAFGVLLDTFLVRTILVPALVLELDRRVWWPSRLGRPA